MNWQDLPENYTDAQYQGLRKYRQIQNEDGTVSFLDVTEYTQEEHSFFSATDANQMNAGINLIMNSIIDGISRGIISIVKTSSIGEVDEYTITYTDGTTSTFDVNNGVGIDSIEKTGTSGLIDTYTITFTDGTTYSYEVTNGSGGSWGAILGTLSDQTDLQTALDGKLSDAPSNNNAYGRKSGGWYDLDGRYYTETEVDTALNLMRSVIAYYENGDTATQALPQNACLIWKGLPYMTTQAISVGSAISGKVTAITEGFANIIYATLLANYYQSSQVDTLLDAKAPLASPAFTDNPTAPTQSAGNNSTRLATTAFVQNEISDRMEKLYVNATTAYTSMSNLCGYISNRSTGDVMVVRIHPDISGNFYSTSTSYASFCFITKGSASNAYFFAFTRDRAAVGNINIGNESVTAKTMLS